MTKKFRYGIIGAGSMGREHIRNVNIIDGAEIVALADPNADSISQSLSLLNNKVQTFKDYCCEKTMSHCKFPIYISLLFCFL